MCIRDRLKTHPVEGFVQFEGRPLPNAFVVLHPKGLADAKVLPAHAKTDTSGKFKASTYDANDGAIAGEYSVMVEYQELVKTDAVSYTHLTLPTSDLV